MKSKFDFFEIVQIHSKKSEFAALNGKIGAILGKTQTETAPIEYYYSVNILDNKNEMGESILISESDLISTGKRAKREDFYPGDSIKVHVDPETGEGTIVEYNKNPLNKEKE